MSQKTLNIIEIFNSIQGEGSHIGEPSTFIRTAGCNLACPGCFGIIKGRRIPQIISSNGINKKLYEIKEGDKLLTFDSNSNLVETYVTKLHRRIVDSWYRITIDGTQYFVTDEHPFFTTVGLIEAKNLQIGDIILHLSWHDKLSFMKIGDKNPMKDKNVMAKKLLSCDYEASGRKLSKTIRRQIQKGNYIAPWYKLSEEKQNELKELYSEQMKGNRNPRYTGIRDNYNELREQINSKLITECSWCHTNDRLFIVHHKDGNPQNDSKDNLVVICRNCHDIHHGHGYNFWRSDRSDGKIMGTELYYPAMNGLEIQAIKYFNRDNYPPSIKPKPLTVYNLSCEPYNSYLIDWMWVHNCDSPYSWGQGTEMTIHEIFDEVKKYSTKNIVLTGGEPTLQEHGAVLCRMLQHNDYKISVQTNGTQWTSLLDSADHVLMDMKPKMSDLLFITDLDPDRDEVKVLAGDVRDLEFAHKVNKCASEYNLLTIIQVKNDFKNDTYKDLITKYKWLLRQEFLEPVRVLPDLYNLIKF